MAVICRARMATVPIRAIAGSSTATAPLPASAIAGASEGARALRSCVFSATCALNAPSAARPGRRPERHVRHRGFHGVLLAGTSSARLQPVHFAALGCFEAQPAICPQSTHPLQNPSPPASPRSSSASLLHAPPARRLSFVRPFPRRLLPLLILPGLLFPAS